MLLVGRRQALAVGSELDAMHGGGVAGQIEQLAPVPASQTFNW